MIYIQSKFKPDDPVLFLKRRRVAYSATQKYTTIALLFGCMLMWQLKKCALQRSRIKMMKPVPKVCTMKFIKLITVLIN